MPEAGWIDTPYGPRRCHISSTPKEEVFNPDDLKNGLRYRLEELADWLAERETYYANAYPGGRDLPDRTLRLPLLLAHGPKSTAELARALGVTRQSAHGMVRKLMERGIVGIRPKPGNAKEKNVMLSRRGKSLVAGTASRLRMAEDDFRDKVGSMDFSDLQKALELPRME